MHVLDLIMVFPLGIILWFLIDKLSDGEFTNELGTVGGIIIMIIFLVIYIILFGVFNNNWIDIFTGISMPHIDWQW